MGQSLRLWAVLLLSACPAEPPSAQGDASVTIDECETDAGSCPAATRTLCRVDRLLATAQLCEVDDDCTTFTFTTNCLNYGTCPAVAVSYRREAQFSIDATREITALCQTSSCRTPLSCVRPPRLPRSECVNGRCALALPDAGSDAGMRDGGP